MSAETKLYIRDERRKQKLTLRDLAAKTGVDFAMLSKYENGLVQPPAHELHIIAEALNVSEDVLMGRGRGVAFSAKRAFTPQKEDKEVISLRISISKLERLDQISAQADISRNELINQCINFALDNLQTAIQNSNQGG
ncbi:MAG: helix-turn-helix domain-containing protein [Oscillospiraceae bacterium]|nr:helix-turn-helix domain-containing protein [Oscillospiraceae bacterium]